MTFYKYYRSKEEVVESYLQEIISGYIENNHGKFSDNFPSFENTLAALNYFDSYADFFLVLDHAGLYNLLIDAVNTYMEDMIIPRYDIPKYKIYSYARHSLKCFYTMGEKRKN